MGTLEIHILYYWNEILEVMVECYDIMRLDAKLSRVVSRWLIFIDNLT